MYHDKFRKRCPALLWWVVLLFLYFRKGKTRAVRVIKNVKCLPYGKHLNIPELFSQENRQQSSIKS